MVTCPTCGQPLAFMYWQGVKVSHCFHCQPCYIPAFCVTKYELDTVSERVDESGWTANNHT